MRRIIYCPDESMFSVAKEMAVETKLPINIGDFEEIYELVFDRRKVQILNVPEHRYFDFIPHVDIGLHQNVMYYNDFISIEKNIILCINGIDYLPSYEEKNKAKFTILEDSAGFKECIIKFDKENIGSFSYEVS